MLHQLQWKLLQYLLPDLCLLMLHILLHLRLLRLLCLLGLMLLLLVRILSVCHRRRCHFINCGEVLCVAVKRGVYLSSVLDLFVVPTAISAVHVYRYGEFAALVYVRRVAF